MLDIGSKCSVLLPEKFINPHKTPAKGMVINKLLGLKCLVLLEEVWQFNGLIPTEDDILSWGWEPVPRLLKDHKKKTHLLFSEDSTKVYSIGTDILGNLIQASVISFKEVNGFI